ncbi:pectate lyase-like adhesive domain-containing protein [Enterococcus sp. AZ109]|uniref:pectate lyase-like adhesive domain-containing protein n=1 Tax=Enterococcus sp. AZ109 TaxID=2774634 RepID=UPI003F2206DD
MKRKTWLILLVIWFTLPNTVALGATESVTVDDSQKTFASLNEDSLLARSSNEVAQSTSSTESESVNTKAETIEASSSQESNSAEDEPAERSAAQTLAASDAVVGDWTSFVNSIRDETITKITLTASFASTSLSDGRLSTYPRRNDLEIDGQGNRVDFRDSSIWLDAPSNGTGSFHMHDIVLNQQYLGAYSEDIVGTRLNYTNGGKWRYRFGNVTTEPGVQRLARASYGEVTVYGNMDIDTRAENFYLGSFVMEDNTVYTGNVNVYDFSVFWYNVTAASNSTGASREFTIGKNCKVNITQSQTGGTTYPAVYLYYQRLNVGENSIFNVNMPGNAVRFDENGSGMIIKPGAVVNLTSKKNSGAVIAFSNNNTYLEVNPGAFFYVIGRSSQPLINMSSDGTGIASVRRQNTRMVLNSPAQYDLRNLYDGRQAVQIAMGSYADNSFQIIDSDIDLWKLATQPLGPSDETYAKVASFEVKGNGTNQVVSSTDAGLSGFNQRNYRRISGMNQNPTLEWTPITDADKTLQAQVIIGKVPDNNGSNSAGDIHYIPVYASKNQATVTITDSYGQIIEDLTTNENGYISYQADTFQKAGKEISGSAKRGPWISESPVSTTVIDVTPPEPAVINDAMKIESITPEISGTGEPGSIITLAINGQEISGLSSTVEADGSWVLDISSLNLKQRDILQLFLRDKSGLAGEITNPPATNNEIGNIQPATDMTYRDATFKAATTSTIVGYLSLKEVPDQLNFGLNDISNKTEIYQPQVNGKLEISDSRSDAHKPWRITVNQSEEIKQGSISLIDSLYYTSQLGELPINVSNQVIETGEFTEDGVKDISADWQTTGGFKLIVPPEKQRVGTYSGRLSWKLEDVPGN